MRTTQIELQTLGHCDVQDVTPALRRPWQNAKCSKTGHQSTGLNSSFWRFRPFLPRVVRDAVTKSKLREGQALVFASGSTAGVTTVEFEPGLVKDLDDFFQKIILEGRNYQHNTWGDDNCSRHVRALLLKSSLTIPFESAVLLLGTWQQGLVVDFDMRARRRGVVFQIMVEY